MQAKEIGMFVLAISLAVGVINTMGIFPPLSGGEAATATGTIDVYAGTGIADLDSIEADDQSSVEGLFNTGLIGAAINTLTTMVHLVAYPYGLLTGWGVPALLALPVQVMFNAATVWSIMQFISNRSGKSID